MRPTESADDDVWLKKIIDIAEQVEKEPLYDDGWTEWFTKRELKALIKNYRLNPDLYEEKFL